MSAEVRTYAIPYDRDVWRQRALEAEAERDELRAQVDDLRGRLDAALELLRACRDAVRRFFERAGAPVIGHELNTVQTATEKALRRQDEMPFVANTLRTYQKEMMTDD